jgi:CheY-like chemotaxis protein
MSATVLPSYADNSLTAGKRRSTPQRRCRQTSSQEPSAPGVMIVDGDARSRASLQASLKHFGFRVWAAASGPEAVELYHTCGANIGVVLLDMDLPGLDGPSTLVQLRRLDPAVRCCFMAAGPASHCKPPPPGVLVLRKFFDVRKLAPVLHDIAMPWLL